MTRTLRAFVAAALLTALMGCSVVRPPPAQPPAVRLDVSTATASLDLLQAYKDGKPWDAEQIRQLVATPAFQALIAHHGALDHSVTEDRVVQMLAALRPEGLLSVREGRIARLNAAYQAAAGRLPELRAQLEQLPASGAVERAARQAQAALPPGSHLEATVYVAIDGCSPAYAVEDGVVLDLSQLPATADVEQWLAHELHHVGLAALLPEPCADPALAVGLDTLAGLVQEGAATYWIDGWYAPATADDRELVQTFLVRVLDGRLAGDQVEPALSGLLGSGRGPLYRVGNAMIVELAKAHGDAWVRARLGDPVELLRAYCRGGRWPEAREVLSRLDKRRGQCPAWFRGRRWWQWW